MAPPLGAPEVPSGRSGALASLQRRRARSHGGMRGIAWQPVAIVLAIVALSVAVYAVPTATPPAAPGSRAAIERFWTEGPRLGTWSVRDISRERRAFFAEHPQDASSLIVGPVHVPDADPDDCCNLQQPCAYPRSLVPRFFFRAPAAMFFANYVQRGDAVAERLEDGTDTFRSRWVPRADPEGMTSRTVWVDAEKGDVLRIDDRSRTGHVIRAIRYIAETTGNWTPENFDPETPLCTFQCNKTQVDPAQQLEAFAADAPFTVVAPKYLPAGFALIRADLRECALSEPSGPSTGAPALEAPIPARFLMLLYSDGMASISVGAAPRTDMDAIERRYGAMGGKGADPEACPGLPASPNEIRTDVGIVRRHADVCRTVFRRDGVHGVSVTVLGNREVPDDEYLEVILSMEPVAGDR